MILVTGANGVVGKPLCQRLLDDNKTFKRVSRSSAAGAFKWDLNQPLDQHQQQRLQGVNTLIHCAPIWLLMDHINVLHSIGITRMVIFSSTSVISKQASTDKSEQTLVKQLSLGELALHEFASNSDLNFTILRPSMIYGHGHDQNVSHIARFIKKYRCMILMGKAKGLRQPVHCNDLVEAALTVIDNPNSFLKTYNLAGAEVLSYRQMVQRIFSGLGRKAIIISVPLSVFRIALRVLSKVGGFSYTPEMANRMDQDLAYSHQDAADDFGYHPQRFLENPKRDLPK